MRKIKTIGILFNFSKEKNDATVSVSLDISE